MENDADAPQHDELDHAATEAAAAQWAEWAAHDLRYFVEPIMKKTGLTRLEVLMYLMSERLAQLAEEGITMRVFAHHEVEELPPPEDDADTWKKEN